LARTVEIKDMTAVVGGAVRVKLGKVMMEEAS
jgi:hypothetical protein